AACLELGRRSTRSPLFGEPLLSMHSIGPRAPLRLGANLECLSMEADDLLPRPGLRHLAAHRCIFGRMNEPMMFLFTALLVGCSSGNAASAGRGLADPAVANAATLPASGSTGRASPVGRATGTPGVWENVTPPGMSLDSQSPGKGDNYGVQDV